MSEKSNRGALLSTLSLALLGLGCSAFPRDWDALAPDPQTFTSLEGRWEGVWKSEETGHEGPLRCIVTRDLENARIYSMRYRAEWGGIFKFNYTVDMHVEEDGEVYLFEGAEDLGWFAGGVYEYNGTATRTEFAASYEAANDAGTFVMARPGVPVEGDDEDAGDEPSAGEPPST